jgi:DNA-binding Lrp family transcriptional regulator
MQANQEQQLDAVDKRLLNEIQWVFPLVDRPYLEIAKRYDISTPFLTQGDLDTRVPLLHLQ